METPPEEHTLNSEQAFELAIRLHQGGRYKDAENLYRGLLETNPNHLEALHLLGALQYLLGKHEEGNDLILRALAIKPDFVEGHFLLGNGLRLSGQLDTAIASYKKATDLEPTHAGAQANLGLALMDLGEPHDAITHFRLSIAADPEKLHTRCHLGQALNQSGQVNAAIEQFQETLKINPAFQIARNHLGHALADLNRLDEAESCFREGIERKSNYALGHYNLALVLSKKDNVDGAISSYREATRLDPEFEEAHHNLAKLLIDAGELEDATQHLSRAAELNPKNPTASYLLQILKKETISRAPEVYVKTLFDQYAANYDEHLVNDLGCTSPQLLLSALEAVAGQRRFTNALDLGCGTGLAGACFRNRVDHLTGVDLSPEMIARAFQKEHYEVLRETDILNYLSRSKDRFDLVIAADCLPYLGDLTPVVSALSQRMPATGLFLFTIESGDSSKWEAQPSGRFAHSATYIESLATKFGFQLRHNANQPIRKKQGGQVMGNVVILEKR